MVQEADPVQPDLTEALVQPGKPDLKVHRAREEPLACRVLEEQQVFRGLQGPQESKVKMVQ